jgi:ferric-dicitrate binding protein FerR (iron transport regulator)
MNLEYNPMDSGLENAVNHIREESVDPAVIEAAAARVWSRIAAEAHATIRTCADFQSLIPDLKTGRLPQSRALLVKDHLHECVNCRRTYEGRVVSMPVPAATRKANPAVRWAIAAGIIAATGLSVWVIYDQFGGGPGRAIIQAVNGSLYEILPTGVTVLAAGQELPDGAEIRTAKDSDAMVKLKDGSVVELRERSGFSTTATASDMTIRLTRGSIIVQAAKRSSGHLYVATPDCRVAVTGTVFSVTNGAKGSRVSVIQGEVHVTQENTEKVLHPGDQTVTSPNVEPVSVRDDIGWSRNREKLVQQLDNLRAGIAQIQMPQLRYSSKLLGRLPASTAFVASIPNLSDYLAQVQVVFRQKMAENPELQSWWSDRGAHVEPILDKLRAASEYLGDEILIAVVPAGGNPRMPVFLAESRREGFADFLKQQHMPLALEQRGNVLAFGPDKESVATAASALDAPSGGFSATPFYTRINESYANGAGILLAADLAVVAPKNPTGIRYFIGEEKQVNGQMQTSASLGFDGARTGIASWLAAPAPMGALDYVSPEATIVAAFVVKSPKAIVDEITSMQMPGSQSGLIKAPNALNDQTLADLHNELAAALGSEFALSLDGSAIPVPSWKLVVEAYDPAKIRAALQKLVDTYNVETVKAGNAPVRTTEETVEGRTYYGIIGTGGPLTEIHYTFADGYMIAGPTRVLLSRALQVKASATSITRSAPFLALVPHDRYVNFSGVIYQNLGTTLAPLVSLFGGMIPQGRPGEVSPLAALSNMKSTLIAAYGEPDRIRIATSGNLMGISPANLLTGNLQGAIPFTRMMGTNSRATAFK